MKLDSTIKILSFKPCQQNSVFPGIDVVTIFNKLVEDVNSLFSGNKLSLQCHKNGSSCPYNRNIKSISYLYSKGIVNNKHILSFSSKIYCGVFSRANAIISFAFRLNYLEPAFFYSSNNAGIARLAFDKDFL